MSETTPNEVRSQESGVGSAEPLGNVLVRDDGDNQAAAGQAAEKQPETPSAIYDASARNRFPYSVRSGGTKYDVAHVFGPLSDERYMQWNRDLKVRGNADEIEENSREASVALWDDLIVEVEGVEYDAGTDWKQFIPSSEKLEAVNDFLAVAIVDDEEQSSPGKLRLGDRDEKRPLIVTTEAWFNGEVVRQRHDVQPRSFESEKKYERIQAKRIRQEPVKGLNKRKPKIEYIPQDESLGKLYDDMCLGVIGFLGVAKDVDVYMIPLRFKVVVIHHVFAPTLDPRTLGK